MLRLMAGEVADALEQVEENDEPGLVSIATGRLPYPYMEKYADWIRKKFPNRTINIYPIRNDFFGESITVSGLITAKDLIAQLKAIRNWGNISFFLLICSGAGRQYS